jgi:hypothetical protein
MNNENLPIEVASLAQNVSEQKRSEVLSVLQQIFSGTEEWEKQVDAIEVKSITDTMSIQLADTARKNAKNARLNAEKIYDAKRDEVQKLKQEFDIEDKLWLKAKQITQIKFKAIEEKAEWKANFVKRYEAEQKELNTQKRIAQVAKYAELNRFEFENMSEESFNTFLNGLKSAYEAKIEAERKAEAERIAKEKAEAEERIRIKAENDRLKAEAEAKEKELAKERAKANAEAEKLRKENEAKLKAEQQAKAKIEAELKAKKEAEFQAEQARLKAEQEAKKEAEKLAKAPIKKQLNAWVSNFQIPDTTIQHEKKILIESKFQAFIKWAKSEIDNI